MTRETEIVPIIYFDRYKLKKLFRWKMNYMNANHRDNYLSLYLVEVDLTVVGLKVAAVVLTE